MSVSAEALGHWTVIHDFWWDSNCQVIEVQGRANKCIIIFMPHSWEWLIGLWRLCVCKYKGLVPSWCPFLVHFAHDKPPCWLLCMCVCFICFVNVTVCECERGASDGDGVRWGSLLRPHSVRPYVWEMRVLGQYVSSLMCSFVAWGLWGWCRVIDPVVCARVWQDPCGLVWEQSHPGQGDPIRRQVKYLYQHSLWRSNLPRGENQENRHV